MKKLVNSIYAFGIYIAITGVVLMLIPQVLFNALQLSGSPNIWVRLLGIALSALGYYYIKAAKDQNLEFIEGTVPVRIGQFFLVGLLLILNGGPFILLAVSAVELCFGVRSLILLKSMKQEKNR
jgi:hypothetical protein